MHREVPFVGILSNRVFACYESSRVSKPCIKVHRPTVPVGLSWNSEPVSNSTPPLREIAGLGMLGGRRKTVPDKRKTEDRPLGLGYLAAASYFLVAYRSPMMIEQFSQSVYNYGGIVLCTQRSQTLCSTLYQYTH